GADALRFKVLGPIEVSRGDDPLPLRAPLQRKLLAALLAGSSRTVPVDSLTDAIWRDLPPDNARKAFLVCLHRLRRALREPQRISSDPTGYRIRVTADDFDAAAFEAPSAAARRARRAGRPDRGVALHAHAGRMRR